MVGCVGLLKSCNSSSLHGLQFFVSRVEPARLYLSEMFVSIQIKSNHFYCHITTAHVPRWVKFLRACSRQFRNNLHVDSTYLQTYTEDNVQNTQTYSQYTQCTIWHTVINTHSTQYVHILHYVHIYTHNNMLKKVQQIMHRPDTQRHGCALNGIQW